jgi:phosphoribosyl-AMP cyclohydrolase
VSRPTKEVGSPHRWSSKRVGPSLLGPNRAGRDLRSQGWKPTPHNSGVSLDPDVAARLKRSADGLVPAIVQQHGTGEVLMLGWMDDEALARTLTSGRATYWSRSRQEYWVKGESSGHRQWVREVRLDCDGDTLLVTVDQEGPACHTGDRSCFDADVLLPEQPRQPAHDG